MQASNVIDGTFAPTLRLTKAMLLYEPQGYAQGGPVLYASVHPVETDSNGSAWIREGTTLTQEALRSALERIGVRGEPRILPEGVLSVGREHLMWWVPAEARRAWFSSGCNNDRLKGRCGTVYYPPLVFAANRSGLHVHALATNARPTEKTSLYRCPCFNVWKSGQVCTGSAAIPDSISVEAISGWLAGFFRSRFSHANDEAGLTRYESGAGGLWADMLDGVLTEFPANSLAPTNLTLGRWLTSIAGKR